MAKKIKKQPKRIDALVKARERYEDGNSCGDAIANAMEVFKTKDGLDVEALTRCLKDNDCKVPNIDMAKNGATGRFRMCAGLMLRRHAAKKGFMVIGGKKIQAPGAKKRGRKILILISACFIFED